MEICSSSLAWKTVQGSLVSYSPCDHKELGTSERLNTVFHHIDNRLVVAERERERKRDGLGVWGY